MVKKILDIRNVCIFKTDSAEKETAEKMYPSEAQYIVFKKMQGRKNYICFIFKEKPSENYVSSTLFAANHFKGKTGTVCIKAEDFTEYVEFEKGVFVKSECSLNGEISAKENTVLITQEEVLKKSSEKDIIYQNAKEHKKKEFIKKTLFVILIFTTVSLAFYIRHKSILTDKRIKENHLIAKAREETILKEKEAKLKELKEKYEGFKKEKYMSVYKGLSVISNCLSSDASIEEITVEKESFSIELKTKNSIREFENLEKAPYLRNITMSRASVEEGFEKVSFTGKTVKEKLNEPGLEEKIDRKIDFYKSEIKKIETDIEKQKKVLPSEYAKKIRMLLRESKCTEEYLTFREGLDGIVLEVFLRVEVRRILSFLEKADTDEKLKIKSVKIRNLGGDFLTVIEFETGIKKENETKTAEIKIQKINASDVSKKFKSETKRKTSVVKKDSSFKKTFIKNHSFEYFGQADEKNGAIVFLRDKDFGNILQLPLKDELNADGKDSCVLSEDRNALILSINGLLYEVKK